ncbi:uncharacterized protein P884DRAFT_270398 [Thermothelomyces heterothallicus CBS 202.75]|uniref:uncharacterized protein n=1 Tax=Thermothelomyces heterothallicus CBS 202.75 TaxID=1149848 RepID=UPI0037435E39
MVHADADKQKNNDDDDDDDNVVAYIYPAHRHVSAYHFALTFDADYCLIGRDLGSTYGITVIYDNMERGRIIVKVSKFLQFRLVVPRHDIGSKSYRDKLLDFDRVGPLSRVDTTAPSGARTPASGPGKPVTVSKKLGAGAVPFPSTKASSFGISREGDTLKTICGTYVYLAPEVYEAKCFERRQRRPTYTALVDVWSLGVVLARLLCGLPKQEEKEENMGVEWCRSIREKVKGALRQGGRRRRQELLSFVLKSMLCLDPDDRKTAAECHKEALLLLLLDDDDGARESHPGEVDNHHHSDGLDTDTEASTILGGEADGSLWSSLSRYIVATYELGRRDGRSCNAPSPKTAAPRMSASYGTLNIQNLTGWDDVSEAARRLEKRVKTRDGYEGKYQAAKAAVEQQQSRVDWVLSEIEEIEAEQKAAASESGGSTSGSTSGSSRKRRHTLGSPEQTKATWHPQRNSTTAFSRLGKRRRTKKVEEMEEMD